MSYLTPVETITAIEHHRAAGSYGVRILTEADKVRRNAANTTTYYGVKLITIDGKEVPCAIKIKFDGIGKTDSLEKRLAPATAGRKKGSPAPQLVLSTKYSKKDESRLAFKAITMVDEEIERYVNKLKAENVFDSDAKYFPIVQKRTSKGNAKNPNQPLDHPIARLEYEFAAKDAAEWKNTKFYEASKANFNSGKLTFPREPVTNANVHEYSRAGRDGDFSIIWEDGNHSMFGYSFKPRVVSAILKGEGHTGNDNEIDENDADYNEYVEYARRNAAAGVVQPAPAAGVPGVPAAGVPGVPAAGVPDVPAQQPANNDDIERILNAGFAAPGVQA